MNQEEKDKALLDMLELSEAHKAQLDAAVEADIKNYEDFCVSIQELDEEGFVTVSTNSISREYYLTQLLDGKVNPEAMLKMTPKESIKHFRLMFELNLQHVKNKILRLEFAKRNPNFTKDLDDE